MDWSLEACSLASLPASSHLSGHRRRRRCLCLRVSTASSEVEKALRSLIYFEMTTFVVLARASEPSYIRYERYHTFARCHIVRAIASAMHHRRSLLYKTDLSSSLLRHWSRRHYRTLRLTAASYKYVRAAYDTTSLMYSFVRSYVARSRSFNVQTTETARNRSRSLYVYDRRARARARHTYTLTPLYTLIETR